MPRLSLGLAAALVVALLAGPVAAEARAPLHVGVSDDASLFGDPAVAAQTVAAWQQAGVDTVRIQVSWARVAPQPDAATPPAGFDPRNPDNGYNWATIDQAVDRV